MTAQDADSTVPDSTVPDSDGVGEVVRVALAVPGVHAVRVEPAADEGGGSMVRLELAEGADEAQVARAVDEALRSRRPPAPRRSDEVVLAPPAAVSAPAAPGAAARTEVPSAAPAATVAAVDGAVDGTVDGVVTEAARPAPRPAARPRTGRLSVPSVASPAVAATPAPRWLGEAPAPVAAAPAPPLPSLVPAPAPAAAVPAAEAAPVPTPVEGEQASPAPGATRTGGTAGAAVERPRLVLERVDVSTQSLTTRASVVVRRRGGPHTGVAEAAATATGGRRAVATAAVRALESVLGGALRIEVEAVSVAAIGGVQTATVLLDAATRRGPEQLVGVAMVRRGEDDAVVRAVLDAANRRAGLDLPD